MNAERRRSDSLHVQYGCGWHAPDSWLNFDASPTLRIERIPVLRSLSVRNPEPFPANVRYGDIVSGLPVEDDSCDLLYCSHVLEHLSLNDLAAALTNSYKILKPGAIWRLVLPDLRFETERYLADPDPSASEAFMTATSLGVTERPRRLADRVRKAFGNAGHLWMWDYESLSARLATAGFVDIRRARIGDAADRAFDDVEDPARWENALGIECRRPRRDGDVG